jgi:formylglycine-generating enzyme required for sulfatase activity
MQFVHVPGTNILMSTWETRVQDYAAFAAANPGVDSEWKDAEYIGNKQGQDHPVVNVSWEDAQAFCQWLSKKEGKTYRLPTDHEWSCAVGIGDREDPKASPSDKDMKIKDVYPWGTEWPPPKGAGNYGSIPGYSDDHSGLAPVGSYHPNQLGIYDLGGNAYEWCDDQYSSSSRVLRGASWGGYYPVILLSSFRNTDDPTLRYSIIGFRVVVGVGER